MWRWANTNNVRTLKLKEKMGIILIPHSQVFFSLSHAETESGLHLEIMNQVSGIHLRHSTPVCIQSSNIVRWKCVLLSVSPTLCCNFFFPVCVHVWVCVRHSAVCFTSCAPGRVITHLCLRTSHLLLKAEDSLSWCQIVVLTVVLKFSSPCSVFCFVRNLFGFNLPDSLLCRCFQLSPTCKEKPLKKRKSVKGGFICLPPSLSSQKEDPQLIYKLYSVWNLFKVLVLSNL